MPNSDEFDRNDMPSLAGLSKDRMARRTVQLFLGDRGRTRQVRALATNLARLVDRSLDLYQQASKQVDAWLRAGTRWRPTTPSPWTYLRAVSTFEELVTCVHRACLYAQRLAEAENPTSARRPADIDVAEVKEMRDTIHHTDDRILQRGRWTSISDGEPVFLRMLNDGLVLGSVRLHYTTLARVIEALHSSAV